MPHTTSAALLADNKGDFEELKGFIQWLDHKYSVHGCMPNAAPSGSDSYVHRSGGGSGPYPEANAGVEVTALHLLAARDYYHATHDLQTLTNADHHPPMPVPFSAASKCSNSLFQAGLY